MTQLKRILYAFLIVALLLTAAPAVSASDTPKFASWKEIRDFAIAMHKLRKSLPVVKVDVTEDLLKEWVQEMGPYFVENGLTIKTTYPKSIGFAHYEDDYGAAGALHILGTSDCGDNILISDRLKNPVSTWYRSTMFISTIAHEMVHGQQGAICRDMSVGFDNIEQTAQIGMVEVLASMTIGHNKLAAYALVYELDDIATGAAMFMGMSDKYAADYQKLSDQLFTTPFEQANQARIANAWKGQSFQLMQLLIRYEWGPANRLLLAHYYNRNVVTGLALPITKSVTLDDFSYFLGHAEDIIKALNAEE